MNLLISAGLISAFLSGAQLTNANATLSQSALKQHAVGMCSKAVTDEYGEAAIVGIRQRVEWQRAASRLDWHDGLNAKVRMVLRLDEQTLARVECNVDQRSKISLAIRATESDGRVLFVNTQP